MGYEKERMVESNTGGSNRSLNVGLLLYRTESICWLDRSRDSMIPEIKLSRVGNIINTHI